VFSDDHFLARTLWGAALKYDGQRLARLLDESKMTLPTVTQPEGTPARESIGSWLRRTWKDHTATFLLSVIGPLLVLAIALWLGLNQN